MSTKAQYRSGVATFYDGTTFESVLPVAPVVFKEDFLGKAIDATNIWTALDTSVSGLTTPVLVANAPNGVVSIPLDNTTEAQLSGLTWGDSRTLVLNQGLVFEARLKLSVLPTGAVIFNCGLIGDHNATVDTVAESLWFRADGSGAITVECDDTAIETTKVSTGVTVLNSEWHVYRIDCTVPTDIKFYIDGARVAASTAFDASTTPTLALQPCVRLTKGAATTVGTVQLDYVKTWQNRS